MIDWQCPGIGNPADDIACFLPPGMQMTNGGVVDASLIRAFMDACPRQETIVRYRKLLPHFNWQLAANCLWHTQFPGPGYPEYREAMVAEIVAIESIDGFAAVNSARTGGLRASLAAGRRDGHVRAMCGPVAAIGFGRIQNHLSTGHD